MVESQSCFEMKNVGANLKKEHKVFNLIYLIEIFDVFYPEFFRKRQKREKTN